MQADGNQKMKTKIRIALGQHKKVTEAIAGDICAVVGFEEFNIEDNHDAENPAYRHRIMLMSLPDDVVQHNNLLWVKRAAERVVTFRDRLMKETKCPWHCV
jgi:GTP-binding protein